MADLVDVVERTKNAKLSKTEIKYAIKRTLTEFNREGGMDLAAQLTYFVVLAIAPALLAVFSLTALLLSDYKKELANAIKGAIENSNIGSGSKDFGTAVSSTLDSLMGSTTGGTVALIIGILTALWSVSAFVKAFSRVSNRVYKVEETRGIITFNGSMFVLTGGLFVGILLIIVSVLLSDSIVSGLFGPIFHAVGLTDLLMFLTHSFLPLWAWIKWPVILILLFSVVSLLFWGTPNLQRPFRFVSPGGIFTVIGIAFAFVALSIYMSTLASYSSYGAIGSVMAVLFVLWVTNTVLILGATLDAELVRARQLAVGEPAERTFELPLRGTPGPSKAEKSYTKLIAEGREIRVDNLHENQKRYRSVFPGQKKDSDHSSVAEANTAADKKSSSK